MGVQESIGYRLVCDFPGCNFDTESMNQEYGSWTDRSYAVDEWREGDGYVGPEGVFCPTHTIWTADEDDDRVEILPMPHTIDSLFILAQRRLDERIENAARIARVRLDTRCRTLTSRDANRQRRVDTRMMQADRTLTEFGFDLGGRMALIVRAKSLVDASAEARKAIR